ncbi:putative vacuolar protein sorting-associated protein [Coniochaeta sp. PMI_546]|nr:putative vacuolar protein sorting-associated protein [Coniochaeta sp. PMI_546]
MRARGAFGAAALLVSALFATPLLAKKDGPDFKVHQFPEYPENLNYFENSDVIIFQHLGSNDVYRSPDAGATWERVEAVPEGKAYLLYMHEYDSERAYILTQGIQHYRTHDRGKTWEMFQTDAEVSMFRADVLQFHAEIPDRIIFNGMDCQGIFCEEVAMYTTDGFRTAAKFLRGNTAGCWWAKSSRQFSTTDESKDKNRVLCIVRDSWSPFKEDQRLVLSDNFFDAKDPSGKIQEQEPNLDTDRPVQGIVNIAIVKKFLLVATTSLNTDEMALFVTDDTLKWHRAMFPTDHRLDQNAYTVLESTDYSIQIDVMNTRPSNPMGVMLTSNSNGTYFTRNIEHTNRNKRGHVDFEKVAGIQGIFLLNEVENWEDVEKHSDAKKKIVTKITFDDGRTFEDVSADGKSLHLHSVTELRNVGRVFSSPAPGLVMGNGNTGDSLKEFDHANLYISDDAGKTWIKGPEGPHKYEFGDQGSILVAVRDTKKPEVSEIKYSLDHGQNWLTAALPNDIKIKPIILTTTQDSTSLKFILVGEAREGEVRDPFFVITIDFDGLHEDTCKKSDLEDWFARVDGDGKPTCLMGHTQKFQRRKKNAECFMKAEHKDLVKETEDCECTDLDFECDYNFVKADGKCVTKVPIVPPEEACKDGKPDDTFLGPSGYRLIPGNTCKRKSGPQKDDKVERKCSEATTPGAPASGEIDLKQHVFNGDWSELEKHYLERGDSSNADDETILVRLKRSSRAGPISITQDHGKTWDEIKDLPADDIVWIIPHHYFKDMVFFITKKEKVHYTSDRGQTFRSFKAPTPPYLDGGKSPLAFHPDNKNMLIWIGEKCEHNQCHLEASISQDRGDHWKTMIFDAVKCEFTGSHAYKQYHNRDVDQILCIERREDKKDELQLVVSNDFFKDDKKVVVENTRDFATMAEFIVTARENKEKKTLEALTSLDGIVYAEAHYPYNFKVSDQHAYTVLDSSTHAVNLLVVTELDKSKAYGSIMKSNSNGTSYVLSIAGVNCNEDYYVDFEKMQGLEGVALVNIVANRDVKSEPKVLQTKITHNDGAEWAYLPPPKVDLDGKSFCTSSRAAQNQGDEKCALHIHGYTERSDARNLYSSKGAVGLMFGWGNVGSSLGSIKDADTFMTRDAGITWTQVQKGKWKWSLGDQGSIIVLVQTHEAKAKTNFVYYSIDEGVKWEKKEFSEEEVEVTDISTMRSGGSRNFLIYGKKGSEIFTVNLDFTGLSDRECKFDENDGDKSDYYLWSPKHPLQQNDCLFGHQSQYLRKKLDRKCYNSFKMDHLYNKQNCTCTRQDYECDYNYELDNFGSCRLVEGLQPLSHEQWCKENPNAVEYWEPTGYRRVPLTTCQGGQEFDKLSVSHPCPNHEDEYERAHAGPSGFVLFLAITLPFAAAGAVGWWVWRNWSGTFGQIRLGEQPSAGGLGGLLDSDAPWVRIPVIAISAAVAVVGAIPLVVAAAWRAASGLFGGGGRGGWSRLGGGSRRFTTRDSFARGRGDYAVVDDDEGELLGEDSDEEV